MRQPGHEEGYLPPKSLIERAGKGMSYRSHNFGSSQCAAREARAQRQASFYSCYSPQLPCRHRQSQTGDHTLQSHAYVLAEDDNALTFLRTAIGLSVVISIAGKQPMTGQQSGSTYIICVTRGVSAAGVNGDNSSIAANNGAGHAGKHLPVWE